jgi:hypothetical protein
MGRFRGGRTSLMTGWNLYNYYERMGSQMFHFHPPAYYQAMTQSPPPFIPQGAQKTKHKLVFPDDKLRRMMERFSTHAQKLATEGLNPTGQWYTRRPFDQAIARVKVIMKEQQVNAKEAIMTWDKEYSLQLQLQEQERQLLAEDARNSGVAISVKDSLDMLKVIKDMQAESLLTKRQKLESVLKKLKSGKEGAAAEEEEEVEPVHFERLIDLDRKKGLLSWKLQRVFNPTQIRKIAEAKNIAYIVQNIRDIKGEFAPEDVHSMGDIIAPMDFLSALVSALEIDKAPATSMDWGKTTQKYSSEFIDGKRVSDLLQDHYNSLEQSFKRFTRLTTVTIDNTPIMELIGVQKPTSNQSTAIASLKQLLGEEKDLTSLQNQLNAVTFGLRDAVTALTFLNWKGTNKLEEYLPDMEELFGLLEVSYYMDERVLLREMPVKDETRRPRSEEDEEQQKEQSEDDE